jgi:hypothetical protein
MTEPPEWPRDMPKRVERAEQLFGPMVPIGARLHTRSENEVYMTEPVEAPTPEDLALTYLRASGLTPTPDAVGQLVEAFLPCLKIMCERGYDPNGANWREGGWKSQLVDIRKKFKRLWYHAWIKSTFVVDHPRDMINYLGYYIRLEMKGEPCGDWGEPE